ncbi:uncharacterized protein JCM10292_004150, partial [Rhodotorula paludigena]|uniref:uncharacterized protein n=1 Tax=Rhodotorula paludigena TaxID=86838 RepID=UPI0031720B7A
MLQLLDISAAPTLLVALSIVSLALVALEPRLRLLARLFPSQHADTPSKVPEKPAKPTTLPEPDPLLDFDLATAKTRDHLYVNKTLRWPYFQTMAHQPMQINNWIEVDSNYEREMAYKARVVRDHPDNTILSLAENDAGCGELLQTLVDYLPKRYPTMFEKLPGGGIRNKVLGEEHPNCDKLTGTDALHVVSRLVQDDFLMGREREDGHVYFVGGVVAIP